MTFPILEALLPGTKTVAVPMGDGTGAYVCTFYASTILADKMQPTWIVAAGCNVEVPAGAQFVSSRRATPGEANALKPGDRYLTLSEVRKPVRSSTVTREQGSAIAAYHNELGANDPVIHAVATDITHRVSAALLDMGIAVEPRDMIAPVMAALADAQPALIEALPPEQMEALAKRLTAAPSRILVMPEQHDGPGSTFQKRVAPWTEACFGEEIARDPVERLHRFYEEATEIMQALGVPEYQAIRIARYVYNRPAGEAGQEVGGTMVTLAALCNAFGIDMHAEAERELARVWSPDVLEKVRAKQAAKPRFEAVAEVRHPRTGQRLTTAMPPRKSFLDPVPSAAAWLYFNEDTGREPILTLNRWPAYEAPAGNPERVSRFREVPLYPVAT